MSLSEFVKSANHSIGRISKLKLRAVQTLPNSVISLLPLIAGLLLVGIGFMLTPHHLSLLNQILILAVFGMAYDVLFGYTGLLSFGHAAFFGAGAYVAVFVTNEYSLPLIGVFGVAIVVGALLSVIIGLISLRITGVYFAMITLALAQLMYILTQRISAIGGASGLSAFGRPQTVLPVDFNEPFQFYLLTVVVLIVTYVILRRILSSPVGDVFRAVRDNEERAEMLGYPTFYYKLSSLVISGIFSTIAGVMFGMFLYFASPQFLFWQRSGDVLLQTLFGGAGTLIGPVIGAAFIVLLEEFLHPITDQWRLVVGVTFILVIIFFPEGIVRLFTEED